MQLYADLSHVYLLGNQDLSLDSDEANKFVAEINIFLRADNLKLIAAKPKQWYLQLPLTPEIKTQNISAAVGKEIFAYLPQGKRQDYWRKLLTEIQMLLHQSPINQQRLARGESAINSLWLWGDGDLPEVSKKPEWKKIFSNEALARGLAKLTQIPCVELGKNFSECVAQMGEADKYLIVIDASLNLDLENWLKIPTIRNKKLTCVSLSFGDGNVYELKRRKWWHWFRNAI